VRRDACINVKCPKKEGNNQVDMECTCNSGTSLLLHWVSTTAGMTRGKDS